MIEKLSKEVFMKRFTLLLLVFAMLLSSFGVMPAFADETYKAEFPFTDIVRTNSSGYMNVKALWEKGIIEGKTDTLFAPNDPLTREEAAKIISLAAELPVSANRDTFTDVVSGSWYEENVETVNESGLMKGIGNNQFGVGQNITRQDVTVLLVRMADYLNIGIELITEHTVADIADASAYAKEAIEKLVKFNVIDLVNSKFEPKEDITRLDFCVWLDRLLISDVNAYDDHIQDWIPVDKDISEYDNESVAFEDFEGKIKTLGDYEARHGGKPASEYLVKDAGVDGSGALVLEGDGDDYSSFELYLYDYAPSTNYIMSWDMKTEGLGDCYARVNLEWVTTSGVALGGSYIKTADTYGDTDWKTYQGSTTSPSPDKPPAYLRIVISIRGKTDGKVYIDNLDLYRIVFEPVKSYLNKPAYKGLITDPNGESDIHLTTYIEGLGASYDPAKCELTTALTDMDGNVITESKITNPTKEMDVTFSSKDLSVGDYILYTKLMDIETGRQIGYNGYVIRKREPDFKSTYSFDEYGRLLRNGEPWFAIGVYARNTHPDAVEDFKDSPIDFVIENSFSRYWTSKEVMDKLAEYGMTSMISTESMFKDAFRPAYQHVDVTTIASERAIVERTIEDLGLIDHPAHLGYQTNNESPANEWAERLAWQQKIFDAVDFNHLTYGVGAGGKQAAIDYARCQDIYAPDRYPIEGFDTDDIRSVYDQAKGFYDYSFNRPMWFALQISDLGPTMGGAYAHRKRGPNETELRNMAWQSVCGGTQGIIWYAHFHLDEKAYPNISRPKSETMPEYFGVTEEVLKFKDAILSVEDAPDVYPKAGIPEELVHLVRRYDGKTYVFLVNMDKKQSQSVSIKLSDAKSVFGAYANKEYKVDEEGYVDISLDALGVEVLIIEQGEQLSCDCTLDNLNITNGEKSYFVSIGDNERTVFLPSCATEIYYDAKTHKDAKLLINGSEVSHSGKISIEGLDKFVVTVVSEDGAHESNTTYNIVIREKPVE